MWQILLQKFEKHPAQQKVLRILFERGFQVNNDGKVVSGSIEIAHTQLAREAGVDRRVVDATTDTILADELLKNIFQNVRSIPFLRDVAPQLGLGVLIITPDDAANVGILADVSRVVSENGLSIRQAVSDDPYFTDEARLTIITDSKIPGGVVDKILEINSVKGVSIY
ncbi:amino acid-binding protein [Methanohalophilus levihalophilus]|uniref:amino acid-binding protein n=1 Tax=Methanohalophilus levihalophilus TaxID=1431282 RepID=UPI001AE5A853|nr:amino acid-binding protein [Methanohalophilus levihalophilus]